LVIVDKAVEGVSNTMLARFLNRGRRTLKLDGEVTLLLASSAQLRRLNREFRRKDYPTDVLSFPSEVAGYAGDIAISADIARRNGRLLGHGVAIEIKTLILHGLLHLAGYDHESDNGRMARKEALLRSALGLPEGLIERTNSALAKGKPARPAAAPAKAEPGGGKLRVRRLRPGVRGERVSGGVPNKPVVGLLGLSGRRGKER